MQHQLWAPIPIPRETEHKQVNTGLWIVVFVLYSLGLSCGVFFYGWMLGNHSSGRAISNTVQFTIGW